MKALQMHYIKSRIMIDKKKQKIGGIFVKSMVE